MKDSSKLAFAAAAGAAAAVVAMSVGRHLCTRENKAHLPATWSTDDPQCRELIAEQLARTRAFLGPEGTSKLQSSFIVVVGVGGVGSWVATMLVRSGVGHVRIIDFDQVTLSSLNRHACACVQDVGRPKVHVLAEYLARVAPWATIEPVNAMWTREQHYGPLLSGGPDFVVDCIDNVDTKVDLLRHCKLDLNVPVVSSMGAGCKGDPTRVQVADISHTQEDPLSRVTRRRLRLEGIVSGIPVVFSCEKPGRDKAKLLDLDPQLVNEGHVAELAILQDFRARILPVLGPMPAMFGLAIATHLITHIGNYRCVYEPVDGGYTLAGKNRTKLYEAALSHAVGQMARLHRSKQPAPPSASTSDAGYLIEEVYHGKSILDGSSKIVLSLWDKHAGVALDNLVPLTREQARAHEQRVLVGNETPLQVYGEQVLARLAARKQLDHWYRNFR